MLIDWFTIIAQAINFIILVWLMKRYLYKPVLNAIDERENRIAGQLNEARTLKSEAQKEHETFQQKNLEFDRLQTTMLKKVEEDAGNERRKLFEEARKKVDDWTVSRRETLQNEIENLNRTMQRQIQDEVFNIARKALHDLASADLEKQICNAFIRKLSEMNDQAKTALVTTLRTASEPAVVQSVFKLGDTQRERIQQALHEITATDVPIRFENNPHVIAGIELTANGRKIAWSIAEYLDAVQKNLNELFKHSFRPDRSAGKHADPEKTAEQKNP